MKTNTLIAILASTLILSSLTAQTTEISDAIINWKGSKITSDAHVGTIDISKGTLNFDGDTLVGGSFTVDMNSIVCTDLNESYGAKLVGHLKSDDFFAVADHPEAMLNITNAVRTADGYTVTGDFTIRGITNSETFDLKIDGNRASADLEIDRSKYGVKYASGSFFKNLGDKVINDELELSVSFNF